MDLDELIQKYNRTVRAAGLLRYMFEAEPRGNIGAGAEDVDSGAAVRVPRISSRQAPQGVVLLARRT